MKKNLKLILLLLIVLFLFGFIFYFIQKEDTKNIPKEVPESLPQMIGDIDDLISFSIKPFSKVSGKIEASGVIQGGYFFEANILVSILDFSRKTLRSGYGMAQGDWMTSGPVSFSADLDFTNLSKGPAYIKLQQDDPSGGESGRRIKEILIPIIIE